MGGAKRNPSIFMKETMGCASLHPSYRDPPTETGTARKTEV